MQMLTNQGISHLLEIITLLSEIRHSLKRGKSNLCNDICNRVDRVIVAECTLVRDGSDSACLVQLTLPSLHGLYGWGVSNTVGVHRPEQQVKLTV